jgi:hypothetical protein
MAYHTYLVMICAHCMPLSLSHKVVSFTLLVNSQPSLGYGLPLSLKLIASLEFINLGYLTYLLPIIHDITLLKVFNHLLSPSLFHSTICILLSCEYYLTLGLLLIIYSHNLHIIFAIISTISLHLLSQDKWNNSHAHCHQLSYCIYNFSLPHVQSLFSKPIAKTHSIIPYETSFSTTFNQMLTCFTNRLFILIVLHLWLLSWHYLASGFIRVHFFNPLFNPSLSRPTSKNYLWSTLTLGLFNQFHSRSWQFYLLKLTTIATAT